MHIFDCAWETRDICNTQFVTECHSRVTWSSHMWIWPTLDVLRILYVLRPSQSNPVFGVVGLGTALLQLDCGGWHLFQLMTWSRTWSELGQKYVRTVPVTAASLPPCTIDQGRSIDHLLCDSTSSTVWPVVAWYIPYVRESLDTWSEWSLLTTGWRCHKTCSSDGRGS